MYLGVGTSLYLAPETVERRKSMDKTNRYTDKVRRCPDLGNEADSLSSRLICIRLVLSFLRCMVYHPSCHGITCADSPFQVLADADTHGAH